MIITNHYMIDIETAGRIQKFYETGALDPVIMAEISET